MLIEQTMDQLQGLNLGEMARAWQQQQQDPTAAELSFDERFGQLPVGAGPYVLERWEPNTRLVLRRNPRFWNASHIYLDRIEIELHVDDVNLTQSTGFSVPLYQRGRGVWRQGKDSGGDIDVDEVAAAGAPERLPVLHPFDQDLLRRPDEPFVQLP